KDLYLNALRRNSQLEFRERFRNADIFIIENIEELEGCFSVQEELFHIYNNLIQKNNQLIITSSINPLKLVDFMPRLINRFSTGLSLEIQKPSNNLKIKFIKNKLEDCELFLHDDLINYFLEQCGNASLKKIDVALNKLIAYLSVTKKNINKITIDEVFSKISNIPQAITINDIQTSVSQYFNIQIDLMKTKIRKQDILLPKYIAIYLTRELTNFSLQKISNDFGKIDKSTINHACKKIKNLIATNDDKVCRVVKDLTNLICSKS
ncbi:MAG TPA: DnaA/Hda family protein, partial [bacterium]|nr:DnaA/Hda family protein [bacterium]